MQKWEGRGQGTEGQRKGEVGAGRQWKAGGKGGSGGGGPKKQVK